VGKRALKYKAVARVAAREEGGEESLFLGKGSVRERSNEL